MTRQELFDAMVNRTPVTIKKHKGIINQIAVEDGSGYSFIVTLSNGITLYVRCPKPTNTVL